MSNPNTPESSYRPPPRGMAEVERELKEKGRRTKHMTETFTNKYRSNTSSGKDLAAQKIVRKAPTGRQKLRKSAEVTSPSDAMYVTKTHATMKTRLADELGCEAGDIGDIRPRTLYRLLSSESTDEDPLHTLRLQQAILRADKAIQDQSWLASPVSSEGRHGPRVSQANAKVDHSSKAKICHKKSESRLDNKKEKKYGSKSNPSKSSKKGQTTNVQKSVRTPRGSRTDLREVYDASEDDDQSSIASHCSAGTPSAGTPSVGTPMDDIGTPSIGTPSVCSVTSGLEELIEGLQDLDYPDWYNEECDAEVASLELGNRGDQVKSDSNPHIEDEELKLFEELEAKLAEEKDEADVIKKTSIESLTSSQDRVKATVDERDQIDKNTSEALNRCQLTLEKDNSDTKSTDGSDAMDKSTKQALPSSKDMVDKVKPDADLKDESNVTEIESDALFVDPLIPISEDVNENADKTKKLLDDGTKVLPLNETTTNVIEKAHSNTKQSQLLVCDKGGEHTPAESNLHTGKAIVREKTAADVAERVSREDGINADEHTEPDEVVHNQDAVVDKPSDKISMAVPTQETSDLVDCVDIEPDHPQTELHSVGSTMSYHDAETMKSGPSSMYEQYNDPSGNTAKAETMTKWTKEPATQLQNISQSDNSLACEYPKVAGHQPFESKSLENQQDGTKPVQEQSQSVLEAMSFAESCNRRDTRPDSSAAGSVRQSRDDSDDVQRVGGQPLDESASSSLENPESDSPPPTCESHSVMSFESESVIDKSQNEITSLHSQQTQSDSLQKIAIELPCNETEIQDKTSTETSNFDSPNSKSPIEDDTSSIDNLDRAVPHATPPESESLCATPLERVPLCTTPPESESLCTTPSESESLCTTPPENESLRTTTPESDSPFDTPPCVTPPETASPCVTPAESISPCVTPLEGSSPSATPPVDRCPSLELQAPSHDPDKGNEPVTRRSKKGRSSPAKRASAPAPVETQSSDVKSKTESCVVC